MFGGAAGTATVQLTIPREKNEITTKTLEGCLVKKDANVRSFIEENFKDQSADRNKLERSKYLFYSSDSNFEGEVTKATLTYLKISKKRGDTRQKMKECTVEEPLIIRVHGHLFLCCDSQLNQSKFLHEHCKEVRISQSLDCSKTFYALGSKKNGQLVFTSFGMSQCQSSNGLYKIKDEWVYEKLKDAGPLLLKKDEKTTYTVGYFKKTNHDCRISVSIFGRNQVSGDSAEPLPSGSRVDGSPTDPATFPPGGLPSGHTPTPPPGGSSGHTPTPPPGGLPSGHTPTPLPGGLPSDQPPTPPPGGLPSDQPPTPPPGGLPSGHTPTAPPGGSSTDQPPTASPGGSSSDQPPTVPTGGSSTDSTPTAPPDNQSDSTSVGGSYAADGVSLPTQQQDSRQMAAGGLSNDPVHNTHSPTQEQGQSPGRTRENTSALVIGSSRRNDQPKLPPEYKLEDIIDKDDMNYRRYLLHIAKNLTNNEWKVLGEALEIPHLEQIENDYSGVKEQAYQMLIKWTECKSRPTLAILIGALNRTGQRQFVDEISDYLGDNIKQLRGGTPVRDFHLRYIISDIQDDWKFIGRYLGLKESAIREIWGNYRRLFERARQMLIKWKKVNGNEATFLVLMVALQSVGKENVVRKLEGLAS